ncbi:MAG: hypothetical protein IPN76_35265 [Saprospiraceae bacterium]|jgi:hypothetical protein|nr:hypothetical protein [Saprospiraceae bacterium]
MENPKQIEIKLSKFKLTLLLIGSIAFTIYGAWTMLGVPKGNHSILSNPVLQYAICVLCVVFFGFLSYFYLKKLRDTSPGLIISSEGITDNSSGVSGGFIPWSDVEDITEFKVYRQKFVCIGVKNPQDYIDKQTSELKRKAMQLNQTTYGAAISINANGLECNHERLKSLLKQKFSEFKKKA